MVSDNSCQVVVFCVSVFKQVTNHYPSLQIAHAVAKVCLKCWSYWKEQMNQKSQRGSTTYITWRKLFKTWENMFQGAGHHKAWIPCLFDQWLGKNTTSVPCLSKIRTNVFYTNKIISQIMFFSCI